MAERYVRRNAALDPGVSQKGVANSIRVNSSDDSLRFGTGSSGTSEKIVADTASAQTLTNKTLTAGFGTLPFQTVAAAGTTVADAVAIAPGSGSLILVTGANATKGAHLPTGAAGDWFTVKNDDAANAVLKVYAASGGKINNAAPDAALAMAAKTIATFYCIAADSWVSEPLLPS